MRTQLGGTERLVLAWPRMEKADVTGVTCSYLKCHCNTSDLSVHRQLVATYIYA